MDDIYDIYLRNINRVCKEHYILASILKSYIKDYFQDQSIKDLLGEIVFVKIPDTQDDGTYRTLRTCYGFLRFEKHWNHKYALERLNKIYFHKLKICAEVNNLPRAPSLEKKNIDKRKIPCYCETVSDSSEYHSVCSSLSHLNLFENPQKTSSELFNNNEVFDKDDSDSDSDSSIISVIEVQKPEPEPLEQILTYEELVEELEREKSARMETEKKLKLCFEQLRVKDDNISKLVTSSSQDRLKVNNLEFRLKNEASSKDQLERELNSLSVKHQALIDENNSINDKLLFLKSQLNEIEAEYSYGADQFDLLDNDYNNLKRRFSECEVEKNRLKNELEIVMAEKLAAVENYDELHKKANRMKFLFEGREERIDSLEKLVDLKDLEIKQLQTKLNDLNEIQNCRDELVITKSQNEILNEKLNIRNSFIKKFVNSNSRLFKCYMEMLNEVVTE